MNKCVIFNIQFMKIQTLFSIYVHCHCHMPMSRASLPVRVEWRVVDDVYLSSVRLGRVVNEAYSVCMLKTKLQSKY